MGSRLTVVEGPTAFDRLAFHSTPFPFPPATPIHVMDRGCPGRSKERSAQPYCRIRASHTDPPTPHHGDATGATPGLTDGATATGATAQGGGGGSGVRGSDLHVAARGGLVRAVQECRVREELDAMRTKVTAHIETIRAGLLHNRHKVR